ncbi:vacuolar protein sorting-associated protein 9A [Lathyrus oleraceus]|uniref:vacuolar protein sorting-associated protein 9A n=1 Tax=Pisum sativum TaxID=3888 RepID=UPI0021D1319F|nr:vacuolar protein sorting-associated protein 9A-like [Pisum sativum]
MEVSISTSTSTSFHDFLYRMRHPSSLDLVRAIKSFIVSFSFYQPKPENDGKRVQDFFSSMEVSIRNHPLWATATEQDIDCAMEGLEKYIMTKLFSRTFCTSLEEAKVNHEISEKIKLLQTFLKPQHLDIQPVLHNESSWLLAEKELQKMNAFKAPQEKLSSIMNCCRVINNLLLNDAMSEHVPAGADDFLPLLIYVTIKARQANPPMLHSNLKFIKLYRRQTKLISEAEYYFTNLVSAKTFIIDLNAKSLSMDEIKFEECMQEAKLANKLTNESHSTCQMKHQEKNDCMLSIKMHNKVLDFDVLQDGSNYPYMEAKSKDLEMEDVDILLHHYKDLVSKHTRLCKAINCLPVLEKESLLRQIEMHGNSTNTNDQTTSQ